MLSVLLVERALADNSKRSRGVISMPLWYWCKRRRTRSVSDGSLFSKHLDMACQSRSHNSAGA